MKPLANIFCIFGILVFLLILFFGARVTYLFPELITNNERPKVYWNMGQSLLRTGRLADAVTWKRKVNSKQTIESIENIINNVTTTNDLSKARVWSIDEDIKNATNKSTDIKKLFLFCTPENVEKLISFHVALSVHLPCQVSLVENNEGLWINSVNMDLVLYGGSSLEPEIFDLLKMYRQVIREIMHKVE